MQTLTFRQSQRKPFPFEWNNRIDLQGITVVAFGGAGNLSETFLYAASSCGAQVVIADLPPVEPEKKRAFETRLKAIAQHTADLHPESMAEVDVIIADVTRRADVEGALSVVREKYVGADIVIDFAGIHHAPFDLVSDDPESMLSHFKHVVDINLTGAFIITMASARHMVPRRKGHIIHLCSSGSRMSLYGSYAYNATKHGVEGLVKTAAAQLAPLGVRVNGIAPGTVETDLNRSLLRFPDGRYRPRALSILAHTPSKRFATREGVAESLLAMCIEQRHFTGNVVFADDGYNVEGHSWPEGNIALFAGPGELQAMMQELSEKYPPLES